MSYQSELKIYIEKCLRLGFSESEIRAVLRSVNWPESRINEALQSAAPGRAIDIHLSPNLLFPANGGTLLLSGGKSGTGLPAMNKTVLSLLISLLSRRARDLGKRSRTKSSGIALLSAPLKQKIYTLAAASLPSPLLLPAPSLAHVLSARIRMSADSFFIRLERIALIFGKIILVFFVLFRALVRLAEKTSRLALAAGKIRVGLARTRVASAQIKFPEHIVVLDIFKLAGRMFRTRRLRTFLTISGISVGIGTILFLVSFGYGLQNILFERITTQEALLTLDVTPPADNAVVVINEVIADRISNFDEVSEVSGMIALNGEMIFGGASAAGFVYAVDASYLRLAGIRTEAGEPVLEAGGVIISSAAAKLLGWGDPSGSALDRKIRFTFVLPKKEGGEELASVSLDEEYRITGVIDDPFTVFAYFPLESVKKLNLPPYSQLKVKVKDMASLENTRDRILAMGFLTSMLSETVDQARSVFNIAKLVLGAFGVITLIVSAIGMLNTMTIALLERTQEVGIMKAVGASDFDIWKLFLAEAIIMGFLGGVGGIVIGFASAEIFNYGINVLARAFGGQALNLFQAPMWFVLTIVAFSSCVGVITGLWPARRAAHLDPLDALKYK